MYFDVWVFSFFFFIYLHKDIYVQRLLTAFSHHVNFPFSDNAKTRTSQENYHTMDCKKMICH